MQRHKCKVFLFNILGNICYRQKVTGKLRLRKHFLYNKRAVENAILSFSEFWKLLNYFCKKSYEKTPLFYDRLLNFLIKFYCLINFYFFISKLKRYWTFLIALIYANGLMYHSKLKLNKLFVSKEKPLKTLFQVISKP